MERNAVRLANLFYDAYKVKGRLLPGRDPEWGNAVIALGAHDFVSALRAAKKAREICGNRKAWMIVMSGFGQAANRYLLPDNGEIGEGRLLASTAEICRPVLTRYPQTFLSADIDDGYGGPQDAARMVAEVAKMGAASFQLEDQCTRVEDLEPEVKAAIEKNFGPIEDERIRKSCGFVGGGGKEVFRAGSVGGGKIVLSLKKMLEKLEYVNYTLNSLKRQGISIVPIIRTDILATYPYNRGWEALNDAVTRGNRYLEAVDFSETRAGCIFYEAAPAFEGILQKEVIQFLAENTKGPVSINALSGGRVENRLTVRELSEMGVARVSFPVASFRAYIRAMDDAYGKVLTEGSNAGVPMAEFYATLKFLGWAERLKEALNKPAEIVKQGSLKAVINLLKKIEEAED